MSANSLRLFKQGAQGKPIHIDRVAVHVRYKDIRRVIRQLLPKAIRARATTVGDPARTRQAMKLRAPAAF